MEAVEADGVLEVRLSAERGLFADLEDLDGIQRRQERESGALLVLSAELDVVLVSGITDFFLLQASTMGSQTGQASICIFPGGSSNHEVRGDVYTVHGEDLRHFVRLAVLENTIPDDA